MKRILAGRPDTRLHFITRGVLMPGLCRLDDEGVRRAASSLAKTGYGQYLLELLRARPCQY